MKVMKFKRSFVSLFVVMTMLCAFIPCTVNAYTGTKYGDYLYYEIDNNGEAVTITDCDYSAKEIVIPDKIDNLPVTQIGNYAFNYCSSLTSVSIPDSVTSIGDGAFQDCSSLTSVSIPYSITSIGRYAFNNCSSLISINVEENNQNYCSINGSLFNKDKTKLIQYAIGKSDKEYIIPDSVTSIGSEAFSYCSLTSISIPDSVTSISYDAFSFSPFLTSVSIPDSVTSISIDAFSCCSSLISIDVEENNQNYCSINGNLFNKDKTELIQYAIGKSDKEYTIPDSVTSIGIHAFWDCKSLTSVSIPDSVTSIGDSAFWHCSSLTSVSIPDSVTSIGDSAFSDCKSLTSVFIPNSVTSIGNYTFFSCSKLNDVYYSGTEEQWQKINIGSNNDCLTNANIHYNSAVINPTPIPTVSPDINATMSISQITENSVTVKVINSENINSGKVILALYDTDKILKNVITGDFSEEITFTNVDFSSGMIKAMLWDGFSSMKPLADAVNIQ